MRQRKLAFTLVELLVVIAVLAVLAAVLFPVFRRVEDSSKSAVCLSNFHQVAIASALYRSDYEDRFMPVSDQPGGIASSKTDRTWVQVVLPYTRSFSVFHCPANPVGDADLSTFDQDLVPGDSYSEFYTASLHVNTGYNYQYLAPILLQNGTWSSQPKTESDVKDPSRTLEFVDSKWSLSDSSSTEGGSWIVEPPCRYASRADGTVVDTFLGGQPAQAAFVLGVGWVASDADNQQYGGAWPWHMGRMTIAHVDGSVSSKTPGFLTTGCDVQSNFSGQIQDTQTYIWDTF